MRDILTISPKKLKGCYKLVERIYYRQTNTLLKKVVIKTVLASMQDTPERRSFVRWAWVGQYIIVHPQKVRCTTHRRCILMIDSGVWKSHRLYHLTVKLQRDKQMTNHPLRAQHINALIPQQQKSYNINMTWKEIFAVTISDERDPTHKLWHTWQHHSMMHHLTPSL